jgi:hypothetical protein
MLWASSDHISENGSKPLFQLFFCAKIHRRRGSAHDIEPDSGIGLDAVVRCRIGLPKAGADFSAR